MNARAKAALRVGVVAAITGFAVAALIEPDRRETPRAPAATASPDRVTPDGLVLVTGPELIDRVRRGHKKGTLINAWASWCGSCKDDLPLLLGLKKKFGGAVDVLLVSVDEPETRPAAKKMLLGLGAPSPHFVVDGPLGAFKAVMSPAWPGMLPATFLFDGRGTRHYFWGGPVVENDIVPLLERYLAGENIDGVSHFSLVHGGSAP